MISKEFQEMIDKIKKQKKERFTKLVRKLAGKNLLAPRNKNK